MIARVLNILVLFSAAAGLAQVPEIEVKQGAHFFSAFAPVATYPYEQAEGNIFYSVQKTVQKKRLPIRKCVLFHGYGVNQRLIHLLYRSDKAAGTGLRVLLNLADWRTPTQGMANMYFGGPFLVDWLTESLCEEIYTLFTESSQSTLAEMLARSEAFLKDRVCTEDPNLIENQKACAIVGHSKGGAIVTSIARRCMQQTSLMGREACLRIAEVYSQAGAIQGVGLSALALGLRSDSQAERFKEILKKDLTGIAAPFIEENPRFTDVNLDSHVDLFSDHIPGKTNPGWWDMSPIAPVEKGVPLFDANDVTLVKSGWWQGEYAASGGGFVFWEDGFHTPGCGTTWKKDKGDRHSMAERIAMNGGKELAERITYLANKRTIRVFTGETIVNNLCDRFDSLGLNAHDQREMKPFFEKGKSELARIFSEKYPGRSPNFLAELNWESFRYSDGFVEARTALNFCARGMKATRNRSVSSCRHFDGKPPMRPAVNHYGLAGASLEAVHDIITQLRNYKRELEFPAPFSKLIAR